MGRHIENLPWYLQPPVILAAATGLAILGDSMLYIVLPTHWREAGLDSIWEIGLLLAVNRLIRVPITPLVRHIYSRISPRPVIIAASVLAVISTFGYAFAYGFLQWLLVRCLWGLAYSFLRLGGFFLVVKWADDDDRGFVMGEYDGIFHIGRLVSMLFGGFLADVYGLSAAALAFGVLSIGAPLILIGRNPFPMDRLVDAANFRKDEIIWKKTKHDPAFLECLLLGFLMNVLFQGIFTSSLSNLAEISYGDLIQAGGFAVGAATLSGVIQAVRWGWEPFLAPWLGKVTGGARRRPAIAFSLFFCACVFTGISFSIPLWVWIVLAILIQLCATDIETLTDAQASDLASQFQSKTALMSRYAMASDFGAGVGPLSAYLLADFVDPYAACYLAAVLLAGMFLIYRKQAD